MGRGRAGILLSTWLGVACAGAPQSPEQAPTATRKAGPEPERAASPSPVDRTPPPREAATGGSNAEASARPPLRARLPDALEPGRFVRVSEGKGRRTLRVIHARATVRRALVYLHGMCGNIRAPSEWAHTVSRYATLIALEGDLYCSVPGRRKWGRDIAGLHGRIVNALELVREERSGLLDTERIAVMGYSQGATRVAMLAARYPNEYPWAIAAGMPSRPRVDRIGVAKRIAIVGGEHEPRAHMEAGFQDLERAGRNARFFLLPGAQHGQYGPEGDRVLDEVFRFVFGDDDAAQQPSSSEPSGQSTDSSQRQLSGMSAPSSQ